MGPKCKLDVLTPPAQPFHFQFAHLQLSSTVAPFLPALPALLDLGNWLTVHGRWVFMCYVCYVCLCNSACNSV